ncbi:MAG: DUF1295 domain-containing protein [Bacilli bacterium]|nr:DUF1295 domain-containing protein [Bacilli bacterium]
MRDKISLVLTILVAIAAIVLGVVGMGEFTNLQKDTLVILAIICGCSFLYCFIVGEISRNNSQMDKLWSILPIAYSWVVMIKGEFKVRLIFVAIVATLWGCRLTYNFAKKGAYSIKFWTGEEDYRWKVLRATKPLDNKIIWAIFDCLFISFFQNFVVLGITLPAVAVMESTAPIGVIDILAFVFALGFLTYEIISDHQQNKFQVKKYEYLNSGMKLEELPAPYNRGFLVTGLWKRSRHPNYLGEQGIWVSLYALVIGAGVASYGIFNWSVFGCALLILIFAGSSRMSDTLSVKKYPLYPAYMKGVFKYLPILPYRGE